jgi:hypothetical protein
MLTRALDAEDRRAIGLVAVTMLYMGGAAAALAASAGVAVLVFRTISGI